MLIDSNNSRAVYVVSSEYCKPKRFVRCWNKVERKYIQEQQPNPLYCYNQNMGFVDRMNQNVVKYTIVSKWKNIDQRDESLSLLPFWRDVDQYFLKYSKESRLSSNHVGIRNVLSVVCYDDRKHYQVQSQPKPIKNPFKYLRWSVFA